MANPEHLSELNEAMENDGIRFASFIQAGYLGNRPEPTRKGVGPRYQSGRRSDKPLTRVCVLLSVLVILGTHLITGKGGHDMKVQTLLSVSISTQNDDSGDGFRTERETSRPGLVAQTELTLS